MKYASAFCASASSFGASAAALAQRSDGHGHRKARCGIGAGSSQSTARLAVCRPDALMTSTGSSFVPMIVSCTELRLPQMTGSLDLDLDALPFFAGIALEVGVLRAVASVVGIV